MKPFILKNIYDDMVANETYQTLFNILNYLEGYDEADFKTRLKHTDAIIDYMIYVLRLEKRRINKMLKED